MAHAIDLPDVVAFLQRKLSELAPEEGFQFELNEEEIPDPAPRIDLQLQNLPAAEVLRYVCALADYTWELRGKRVILSPLEADGQGVVE